MPGVSVPGVSVPGVSVPGVSVPGFSVPGCSGPGFSAPGCSVPGCSVPGCSVPGFSVPDVPDVPDVLPDSPVSLPSEGFTGIGSVLTLDGMSPLVETLVLAPLPTTSTANDCIVQHEATVLIASAKLRNFRAALFDQRLFDIHSTSLILFMPNPLINNSSY